MAAPALAFRADLTQFRAWQLRLGADQAKSKIDLFERLDHLEKSIIAGFAGTGSQFAGFDAQFTGVTAQFAQVPETMTTNLDIVRAAIKAR
jgi:hypothetical protein